MTFVHSVFNVPLVHRSGNERPWKDPIWSPKVSNFRLNCACLAFICMTNELGILLPDNLILFKISQIDSVTKLSRVTRFVKRRLEVPDWAPIELRLLWPLLYWGRGKCNFFSRPLKKVSVRELKEIERSWYWFTSFILGIIHFKSPAVNRTQVRLTYYNNVATAIILNPLYGFLAMP